MVIGFENGWVVLLFFVFWVLASFFFFDEEQGYRKGRGHRSNVGRHRNHVGRHNLPFSMHSLEQLKWGQIRIPQVLEHVGRCRWLLVIKQSSTTAMKVGNVMKIHCKVYGFAKPRARPISDSRFLVHRNSITHINDYFGASWNMNLRTC